ncbi:MAG: hypothetical protein AAFX93_15235 [Verrucomicrobiota bacterium]
MSDPNHILGLVTIGSISLLGAVLLVLRIRDHFREKPDPKLTYATQTDLRYLREELHAHQRDTKSDIANLQRLVGENAEHIAALIAQSKFHGQRLAELDRIHRHP